MASRFDTVLHGGELVTPAGRGQADIGIVGGVITAIGAIGTGQAATDLDCRGLTVQIETGDTALLQALGRGRHSARSTLVSATI